MLLALFLGFAAHKEQQPLGSITPFLVAEIVGELLMRLLAFFSHGAGDWQHTYHKIPKFVDATLADRGAQRLTTRGAVDSNDAALFDIYDTWKDEQLWPAIEKTFGAFLTTNVEVSSLPGIPVEVSVDARARMLHQDLEPALVLTNTPLTPPGAPAKNHMELQLPSGMTYRAGDYLAVLPINPLRNVRRAMAFFNLSWDAMITISPDAHTALPSGRPIPLFEVFSSLVELALPATSKQLRQVAETIPEPAFRENLKKLAVDGFKHEILDKNRSLLDVLERYPSAQFSLGQFLEALPSMRIRQYSISSSPLEDPSRCTITYSIVDTPADDENPDKGRFLGVCSNYLRSREPRDWIHIAVRPSHAGFHLPSDDTIPLLMVCAGTGLAPFRAFVQERALKIKLGKQLAPALLFYGCGAPDRDDLYQSEFAAWQALGAVEVRHAYSRTPEQSLGCRHVQDRVWYDRDDAKELFIQNAQIYMCGAGVVGAEINKTMAKIYQEAKGVSCKEAEEWVSNLKGVRYWADVFS